METDFCQACRRLPSVRLIESDEPLTPYRVCEGCGTRLEMLALRPLEWFNLAALHGCEQFHLHDDFYDQEGIAQQPEIPVEVADLFPAPTLAEVQIDLARLLDYARTRWWIPDEVFDALRRHQQEDVLQALQTRASQLNNHHNLSFQGFAYEICANVLGTTAQHWIRDEWNSYTEQILLPLSQATAACLPTEEGHGLVVKALAQLPPQKLANSSFALAWFCSTDTLDWIEQNITDPLVENWGRLAAHSQLSWPRVAKWLASGRPLSLVALDGLNACWDYNTIALRKFRPKLLAPASIKEMNEILNQYLAQDSVPRVRRSVASIVTHWPEICSH